MKMHIKGTINYFAREANYFDSRAWSCEISTNVLRENIPLQTTPANLSTSNKAFPLYKVLLTITVLLNKVTAGT